MTTVAELITEIRDIIDEPIAAQWSDDMLRRWIDEGARDIARVSHHFKTTNTITLTAEVAEYTVPNQDILAIEHAYYDDLTDRLIPMVPRHYEQMDQVWGDRQSWTGVWPTYFTTWGHQPYLKVRFYPVPSVTGHRVKLLSSVLPASIANVGEETQVDIPHAWYDILADYASYKAMLRDRDPMMDRFLSAYTGKRDALIHNNEYLNVAREMVPDPLSAAGYVPRWLADPGWY